MKVYLNGCSGIKVPRDIDGTIINAGDQLTFDYGDSDEVKDWMLEAIFKVEAHESGGLCARGIHKELYLHDFRFKHCKVVNA